MKRLLFLVVLFGPAAALCAADPDVAIALATRLARATPDRQGFTHSGGGNIDVQQPAPDTLVVTMTGVAVAGAHPCKDSVAGVLFDLVQDFEVRILKKGVKRAKITLEARQIGLLRSHACGGGGARISAPARAVVRSGEACLLEIRLNEREVCCGESLSVNDRAAPVEVVVEPGRFVLHQQLAIQASHPRSIVPFKTASIEFAPEPALNALWISANEPFRGAAKKDFGFQVTLKVAAE